MMNTPIFLSFIILMFFAGYIAGVDVPDPVIVDATEISKAQEICTNANSKLSKMKSRTVICENGGEFKYEPKKLKN